MRRGDVVMSEYDRLAIATLSITFISMGLVLAVYESDLSNIMTFLGVVAIIGSTVVATVIVNTYI